ncbi:MAG: DUF2058 domain-containing protein [Desulfobulbaceae bacterium]|nr:DUF2058 domain-containing protein [Desulfobulbaceae bacterium]
MGKSFQDQLLKLGLVDKSKVNEAKKKKHKAKKKQGKSGTKHQVIDENVLLAQKAAEKKKARARELNRQRDAKLQKRAEDARVKQLIEQHKIEKDDKGIAYRFNVSGKIHRVFVAQEIADQLSSGRLGIVAVAVGSKQFEIVPKAAVAKIQEINSKIFVSLVAGGPDGEDPDDPYAEYKVPDDLVW